MTPFDFRPVIWQAVVLFGGQRNGTFSSECFGSAVARRFDLARAPDADWCSRVLRGLDYVVELPGGLHWKTQTG